MSNKSPAFERLSSLPQGTVIYTVIRHVSRTGTSRVIDPFVITPDGSFYYLRALEEDSVNLKRDWNHDGFVIKGAGRDLALGLVKHIGKLVHGREDYFANQTV